MSRSLEESSLAELEDCMSHHKFNCPRGFHRHCLEFLIIAQHYVLQGGSIDDFDPFNTATIHNRDFTCLSADSSLPSDAPHFVRPATKTTSE